MVHGIILGMKIPFPIENSNACKDCGLNCPIKKGQDNNFNLRMKIKDTFPAISVGVKVELKDEESNKDIVCFTFDAKLT